MKLIVVPHGAKVTGVTQYPPELGADPPMTMEGKWKMLNLVPALRALGPYDGVYCSLMDRACGTMCTIVKQLGIRRVVCIYELGQMGNLEPDGKVIMYPGHEQDNVVIWQTEGLFSVGRIIWEDYTQLSASQPSVHRNLKVLVFSHRPILAGLVANAKGITNREGIQKILDDPDLTKNGFVVFNYDGNFLTLVE